MWTCETCTADCRPNAISAVFLSVTVSLSPHALHHSINHQLVHQPLDLPLLILSSLVCRQQSRFSLLLLRTSFDQDFSRAYMPRPSPLHSLSPQFLWSCSCILYQLDGLVINFNFLWSSCVIFILQKSPHCPVRILRTIIHFCHVENLHIISLDLVCCIKLCSFTSVISRSALVSRPTSIWQQLLDSLFSQTQQAENLEIKIDARHRSCRLPNTSH